MERRSMFFGLLLIVAGLLLLGRNLGWIDVELWHLWPLLLIAAGVYDLGKWVKDRSRHRAILPGTVLVVYGVFFLICNYQGWSVVGEYWPVFLLGPGLGALLTYLLATRRRQDLHTGLILSGLAVFFFFNEWRYLLPVALIVIGIGLLVRHGSSRQTRHEASDQTGGQA